MGTRYGRHRADDTYEYHDTEESLVASEQRESSDMRRGLFGLLGLVAGGVLTHLALVKLGVDWPKWLRFSLVIAGSGTLAWVLAMLADIIWSIILLLVGLTVVWLVASLIWKVV